MVRRLSYWHLLFTLVLLNPILVFCHQGSADFSLDLICSRFSREISYWRLIFLQFYVFVNVRINTYQYLLNLVDLNTVAVWGSRIVGTPSGPSEPMIMDYDAHGVSCPLTNFYLIRLLTLVIISSMPLQTIDLYTNDDFDNITIQNNTCVGMEGPVGYPCAILDNKSKSSLISPLFTSCIISNATYLIFRISIDNNEQCY